ncbi:MAG: heme-binding protein [Nitrospirales bacterium]
MTYRGNANTFGTNNDPTTKGKNRIGGVTVFGGGLPLYHQVPGEVLGAIGVSGDSSCADHVIAWRIRHALGFVKIPGGVNFNNYGGAVSSGRGDGNIIFDLENGFSHHKCGNEGMVMNYLPSMENF